MISDLSASSPNANSKSQKMLASFDKNKGSAKDKSGWEACDAYAGENTCCTKGVVKALNNLSQGKIKKIKGNQNMMTKINAMLVQKLTSCTQTGNLLNGPLPASYLDQFTYNADVLACQGKQQAVSSGMARGASCGLCAEPGRAAKFMNSKGNLIITQDSLTAVQTALCEAKTCLKTAQEKMVTDFNAIITKYTGNSIAKCNTFKNNFAEAINRGKPVPNCANLPPVNPFTNTDADNMNKPDPSLDNVSDSAILLRRDLKIMQRILDDAEVGADGLNIFAPSNSDSDTNATGEVTDEFEDDSSGKIKFFCGFLSFILIAIW